MKFLPKILLLALFILALAAPQAAQARAGGGGSMGSMGSHTYHAAPYAAPIQRSATPFPSAPSSSPSYTPSPNPGFASNHPFLTGIAGGLLGASLAHMLFGGGYGMGMGGMGGGFGILPLLLLAGLGYFLFRMMRNNSGGGMGNIGAPGLFPPMGLSPDANFNGPVPPLAESPLTPTPADYQAFMQLLEKIQLAWGAADINHLRPYVTPEMLGYFSEELSANVSRGLINKISDVTVTEGTLLQAWSDPDLDYATVHMKWRATDFMARADRNPTDADYVASGDATHPVDAEEIWTFARARSGGNWLLSAIQQVTARVSAA